LVVGIGYFWVVWAKIFRANVQDDATGEDCVFANFFVTVFFYTTPDDGFKRNPLLVLLWLAKGLIEVAQIWVNVGGVLLTLYVGFQSGDRPSTI